jgi:hypothetical protein
VNCYSTLIDLKLTFRLGFLFVWASLTLSLLYFRFLLLRHSKLGLVERWFGTVTGHRAHYIIVLRRTIAIAFLCKRWLWSTCNVNVSVLITPMFILILQFLFDSLSDWCNYEFLCVWVSGSFIYHVKEHTHYFFCNERNRPRKYIHLIWKNKWMFCAAVLFYI